VKAKAPRSRGRPSKREAELIDRNVLEAAKLSFLADGFAATTMDAIASRAGVTKATLYQRYDDKAALLRAVMQDRIAAWSAVSDARRVVPENDTLDQRLLHYARSMTRWSADPEVRAFGELVQECWGSARHVAVEMQALRTTRMQDVLERDIREFAARDNLAVTDPGLIAAVFMGMLAALHQHLDRPGTKLTPKEIDERLAQIVAILLKGKSAWLLPKEP
jgi:AcrR family transcriptional regulator